MSRHRRANSDLQGVKNIKSSRSISYKETETTSTGRNMSSYEPKSTANKRSNCPETPIKKIDVQELIIDTFKLLRHFYRDEDTQYYNRIKKYLGGEWESQKKNFLEHFNKLTYLEQQMQKKNFHEIELEIIREWRKNPVLYYIRAFWYEFMTATKFPSLFEFMKQYNTFKDFVGQLAYLYFKRFFTSVSSEKQSEQILDKLTQRTSHLIITYTTTWCKLSDHTLIPLLKVKLAQPNMQELQISKFKLESLQMKYIVADLKKKQNQMPKTTDAIQKFIIQHKLLDKMRLLIDIRSNLEHEIKKRQQYLITTGELKEITVLDKDDFVDSLIYCVVKGDVSLQKLGLSINYLHYVMGPDLHNVLSKFRCDPYLADLEAVHDFLLMKLKDNSINNDNFNPKISIAKPQI